MKWENVSIFISSTFQDMHAERDYLVKEVFPELLSWCESRRLHMYDIDLRWGISREDSRNHNTVAACMHNIDRCRPFFVCFLGQRRGWVPKEQDISISTVQEYPNLPEHLGKRSITEMEIEHALLAPMNRMYEGAIHHQEPCRRALFFFRTEDSLDSVPESERAVYLDSPENLKAAEDFKAVIRSGGYPVTEYGCAYTPSPDGHGRLDSFTSGGETLGEVLLRQLKEQITAEFPDHTPIGGEEDPAGVQEEFIWREEQSYYPQVADLNELNRYLQSDERKALCVTGKAGSGKTSLLCAFARDYRGKSRFIPRFCGISPMTSDLYSVLSGILEECGFTAPVMEQELFSRLSRYLGQIASQESTVLLLDGLNQARDGMRLLELLPGTLPEGLKIITSCKEESLTADLLKKTEAYDNVRFWHLQTSCDEKFKRGMIERFLSLYLKKLDEDAVELITRARGSDTPLFLSVILSELRVFGRFQEIREQILKFSGDTKSAFAEILARLDHESDPAGDMPLSRATFGLMACSRNGLSESELCSGISLLTGASEAEIKPQLRILLRQVRPFLARRGQLYDFFHESFRNAAAAESAGQEERFHAALSDAFYRAADPERDLSWACRSSRPLTEYPYHLAMAGRQQALEGLLMDPNWIRNKMKVCGMQALLHDYERTGESRACALTGGALRLSAPVLMEDPSQLAVQLEGRLHAWREEIPEIRSLLEDLEKDQRAFWLRPVNDAFVPPGKRELSFRHGKCAVTALCVHLDDLVVTDELNRMGLYNRQTAERKNLVEVPGALIRCLVSDGTLLYAGCGDGSISVWQTQSSSCIRTLRLSENAINDLKIFKTMLFAADEAGCLTVFDTAENKTVQTFRAGREPLLAAAAGEGRICFGGLNQKVFLLEGDKKTVWKTGSGYVGKTVLDGDRLVYTTFYPRIFFRNLKDGTLRTVDYTDGYDFNVSDSSVMNKWRMHGPYIRDLICLKEEIALATPYSVAVFSAEGADEPSETWPCQDARALAAADDMIYAGNGAGEVFSFQTGISERGDHAKPVSAVAAIAHDGEDLAVAHETSVQLYRLQREPDRILTIPAGRNADSEEPGYFTDVAAWKGGFAAGSFCEFTLWKTMQEEKWQVLHQNMKLMEGINTTESPSGTAKMIPLEHHLVFLSRGHEIFIKEWKEGWQTRKVIQNSDMTRIRFHLNQDQDQADRVEAVAKCSKTVFAAAERNSSQIFMISCRESGISLLKRFPDQHRTRLLASSPDGMLYILGEDGTLSCLDPLTGRECSSPRTGAPLQLRLSEEVLDIAVTDEMIYLSLPGGRLAAFRRETGEPCCVFRADSEIRTLCAFDALLFAGTEAGRFMAFQEENRERPEPCLIPAQSRSRPEEPEPAEKRQPEPAIRTVPPDEDSSAVRYIRVGCSLAPLIMTLLAIVIRGGWPGIWDAVTLGIRSGMAGRLFALAATVVLTVIALIGILAFVLVPDIYYSDTRRWIRSYKLPVLDRFVLPLILLLFSVPCLLLTRQAEGFPAAFALSLLLPFLFLLFYFPGIDMFQRSGATRRLSRDGTFIGMEEAFYNLRIVGAVLILLLTAGLIWAAAVHPQWFFI